MRYRSLLALWFVLFLFIPTVVMAQDPGVPDTVCIDSVAVNNVDVPQTINVPIRVNWDECVDQVLVPVWVQSSDVDLDTVDFTGGFAAAAPLKGMTRDAGNANKAVVYAMGFTTQWCGNGTRQLFATLKIDIPAATSSQCVKIDSTFVPPGNRLMLVDQFTGFWVPRFIPGKINILDGCGVNSPPQINCPGDPTIDIDEYLNYTVTAFDPDSDPLTMKAENVPGFLSFSDNGNNTGTVSGTPGCGDPGVYTIRFIAEDTGLADTCYATIIVNTDNEDPVPICPGDIIVNCDPGQCGAIVAFPIDATDNCPGVSAIATPVSGTFFPKGTTQVTVTATDASGNSDFCTFDVTVNDNEHPLAICPSDITVNNDPGQCGAIVSFSIDATDDCPGALVDASPPSGTFFPVGITQVTVTATDASTNQDVCYFDVTVNDNEDPDLTCPASMTVDCDPGQTYATVHYSATVSDNCGMGTVLYNPPSGSQFNEGTITPVAVSATDVNGNNSICAFTVTVNTACDCGVWGDVTGDGLINPVDAVYMVNFVYLGIDMRIQPPNCPRQAGDVNCDGAVNPVDVVYYVNYVYLTNNMFCADPCL